MSELKEVPQGLGIHVFSDLSPELSDQVQQFRASVSDVNGQIRTPQEEERRSEKFCSDGDAKKWILVFKDKDLVGMAVLFGREIMYKDRAVVLGGIGKVRVREDWRQKGVAKKMMSEVMGQLADMQYDIAFLGTDINSFLADFYRKYGFVSLNRPYSFSGKSGRRYEENDGMLAPIRSKEIFQEIMNSSEPLDIGRGKW